MRLRSIGLNATLALSILLTPLAADAQQAGKTFRVGWFSLRPGPVPHLDAAFKQGLRDLGYIEGSNIIFEHRFADGNVSRLYEFASELARLKVDVIFTAGDEAINAAKQVTSTIPIVMVACDAVEAGLVASLARPGGNVTGVTCIPGDLAGKRLELLREAAPNFSRLAVLYNPGDPHAVLEVKKADAVARALGAKVQALEARVPGDLEKQFSAMTRARAQALFVVGDAFTFINARQIVDLAGKGRLPAIYAYREFVEAGGLMAYGPSLPEMFRTASKYVDKILKGAKPADLPVEQPMKFELVINLKAAKALGLTIPPSVLIRADKVIE